MPTIKMSSERFEQMKDELNYLQTVRTKEVAELIKEARSFGDLSENSEYDEAKTEQAKLYTKIAELQALLENVEIIEVKNDINGIGMGSKVTMVEMGTDFEETYEIVGSQESDPRIGRISEESPIGRALMGHTMGDEITIEAPDGVLKFQIISVTR